MRILLLRDTLLAGLLLALGASACSNPLANCGLLAVQVAPQDSMSLAVGDSAIMAAQIITGCPEKVGAHFDFSSVNTAVATVRAVNDTAAWVKGVGPGTTAAVATSRDRSTIKGGVLVYVH